jgi:hypothetical protein
VRKPALGTLAAVLSVSLLGAAPPAAEKKQPATAADRAVQTQLGRVLPEVSFDKVPLSDVVDFLRDVTGADVFLNWKALEDARIDRDTPVTIRLRDATFAKALDAILKAVGGRATKLGYAVQDGVISISTANDLAQDTVTRVYDVRDLLRGGADAKQEEAAVKLLTDSIDPASWREHGGQLGSVRFLSGQLIVTQPAENHKAIANLLRQTRTLIGLPQKEEREVQMERR